MELAPGFNFAYLSWDTMWYWIGAAILILALGFFLRGRYGGHPAVEFSSPFLLRRKNTKVRALIGGFDFPIIFTIVMMLCLVGLMRPQMERRYETRKESGIEMIVAIDVSRSMLVEDMVFTGEQVNRLTAAKSVIRDFIRKRPMDRIGLIAFAGKPYLASPITLDHSWLRMRLDGVRIGLVRDGTAIGSAIAASARRLDKRESKSKVVVLLTDGANNAGKLQPELAAELAHKLGVRIYTIAVGTPGQHTIPTTEGPLPLNQEFDEETLKAIAEKADGEHFMAEDTENLKEIFAHIDSLEKTEREARVRVEPKDWFVWLVLAAVVLMVIRMVAAETFLKRVP